MDYDSREPFFFVWNLFRFFLLYCIRVARDSSRRQPVCIEVVVKIYKILDKSQNVTRFCDTARL